MHVSYFSISNFGDIVFKPERIFDLSDMYGMRARKPLLKLQHHPHLSQKSGSVHLPPLRHQIAAQPGLSRLPGRYFEANRFWNRNIIRAELAKHSGDRFKHVGEFIYNIYIRMRGVKE